MRLLKPLSPDLVGEMFGDFDHFVNSFMRPTYINTAGFQPSYDVNESEAFYTLSFDMPGVKKEDIKIEVQGNQLKIAGERQRNLSERAFGKFEKTFTLPASVSADKIEAHYENGVLSLALPKAEAAKPRTIEIQSGSSAKELKELKSS